MPSRKDKMLEMLKKSWNVLQERVLKKRYDPQTEADIQCFLYHCLAELLGTAKSIHAEIPHEEGFADLVIDNRIFVEIKYILKSGIRSSERWDLRRRLVQKDTAKLRKIKEKKPDAILALAVFTETYSEKDDAPFWNPMRKACDRLGILFLFGFKRAIGSNGGRTQHD